VTRFKLPKASEGATSFLEGIDFLDSIFVACCRNWELMAAWTGLQIKVPVKFIVGDVDLTYHIPGVKEYISKGGLKKYVPFLQEVVVMEGVGHFLNQEKPEEVSEHIYDFIKKF
jgi:pimeloyl-ACP methyl ester carboxylesterase